MPKEKELNSDGQDRPVVVLQYLTLIHYRESVFHRIASDSRIDFTICCGQKSPYQKMRNFDPQPPLKIKWVKNFVVNITQMHFLVWQWGAITNLIRTRPNVLILLGADPHILSSFPLFFLAKILRVKVCWWSHATLAGQGFLGRWLRLFFYQHADGILAYDEAGRLRLEKAGVEPSTMTTIWNCLNDADYELSSDSQQTAKDDRTIRVLYIGRLYRDKKMRLLLKAAAILKDRNVSLVVDIVGDGPELAATKEKSAALKLNDVVSFHGAKYDEDLAQFLSNADIGVIPSWAGLSAIQYMAAGIPVITEENRGMNHPPEVSAIIEDETGAFFDFESAESLANTIEATFPKVKILSNSCLKLVREQFTPEAVKEAIILGVLKVNAS
ncbi:glycosyltransferase family 4 protein [bacterium]|nr:glycosyltransferase family 4 protein [bacterium]MDB4372229.1 glycosyltransferase family 4 protein [Mariniblastus sp.]MDA7901638.1 glycosyltransferase family 4 protein [bacterium]MDB4368730.1 glycosyltransferase family 4 protein [bacterium]MDB4379890.1 glycosyltransferase family 4 protein [Mariniblastus sp.]